MEILEIPCISLEITWISLVIREIPKEIASFLVIIRIKLLGKHVGSGKREVFVGNSRDFFEFLVENRQKLVGEVSKRLFLEVFRDM